jgi:hypothetical protein
MLLGRTKKEKYLYVYVNWYVNGFFLDKEESFGYSTFQILHPKMFFLYSFKNDPLKGTIEDKIIYFVDNYRSRREEYMENISKITWNKIRLY